MNFSKTTEYALRILSFMSVDDNALYTANELFEKLQIPFRYLRKLMQLLAKKGLLVSVQGKAGGYQLSKPLNEISLMDIIEATTDKALENNCFFGFQACPLNNRCSMHDKWGEVRDNLTHLLKTTTLQNIKEENNTIHLSFN